MFLNNYYQWLNAITHNPMISNGTSIVPVVMYDFYKGDVTQLDLFGYGNTATGISNNDLTLGGQVYLSSATTAPVRTDYNFTGLMSGQITNLNYTFAHSYDSVKGLIRTITITGTATTTCTIRQVGYGRKITKAYNNISDYPVLMAKWVLPEPLVLAAGDGFTITVEWDEGEASS